MCGTDAQMNRQPLFPRRVQELVKRITRKEKEAVHEFVYARGTRELLHVRWDGNEYWLESASGQCCSASPLTYIDGRFFSSKDRCARN